MTIFSKISRPSFTARAGDRRPDVPTPHRAKALRRRAVMFKEASELLPFIPEAAGEATHTIFNGRFDLMVLLVAILEKLGGTCQHLRIATLSFNSRNVSEMAGLLRSERVGRLTLLCSSFFKANNKDEFAEALREAEAFPTWRIAAARSHCKVVLADMGGFRLICEGSANLRTNSNLENLLFCREDSSTEGSLHDWHSLWIDSMVAKHEHTTDRQAGAPA